MAHGYHGDHGGPWRGKASAPARSANLETVENDFKEVEPNSLVKASWDMLREHHKGRTSEQSRRRCYWPQYDGGRCNSSWVSRLALPQQTSQAHLYESISAVGRFLVGSSSSQNNLAEGLEQCLQPCVKASMHVHMFVLNFLHDRRASKSVAETKS